MNKKLKASLVHCQMSPYHSSDTIPYHGSNRKMSWAKSHLLKEKEPHTYHGEPVRLTLCLTSHWNKKTTARHCQRKSPRLAKGSVGVGGLWFLCWIQPHCLFLRLVGANNGFHYFPMVEKTNQQENTVLWHMIMTGNNFSVPLSKPWLEHTSSPFL